MKITFLGVSSALGDGYNSNMLLDFSNGKTLLFDAGMTLKQSLKDANRKVEDIDAIYISHLHGDHCLGLEWIAFYSYFISKKKIKLYMHQSLLSDLWNMLSPSLSYLADRTMNIDDYFDVQTFWNEDGEAFAFNEILFSVHRSVHINNKLKKIYIFSICADDKKTFNKDEGLFYISFDTFEVSVRDSKYIFYDCDINGASDVHADYKNLLKIPDKVRSKTWLYHYHDLGEDMPDAVADGFAGFVKQGQIFEI